MQKALFLALLVFGKSALKKVDLGPIVCLLKKLHHPKKSHKATKLVGPVAKSRLLKDLLGSPRTFLTHIYKEIL